MASFFITSCENKEIMSKKSADSIKNRDQFDALREQGYSKSKSARIANTPDAGKKGGKASPYESRTKSELYQKAKEVGISGRSKMNKDQLIHALREG